MVFIDSMKVSKEYPRLFPRVRVAPFVNRHKDADVERGPLEVSAATKCHIFRRDLRRDVLKTGRQALQRVYGVRVHAPDTTGLSCPELLNVVKEWMEGPEVRRSFRRCGRKEREGGRFSFKLLKKLIPAPCKCLRKSTKEAWVRNQSTPVEGEIPEGFERVLREEIRRIFPQNWAIDYVNEIARNAPNTSSCVEASGAKGGARAVLTLDEYLSGVIGEREVDLKPFKYSEVPTAGKLRPLTITPADMGVLRPLHKLIFKRVSMQRWSLIGPPGDKKFKRAGFRFRDGILSGDYASATDSLDLRVSTLILGALLETAPEIPEGVKRLAIKSLHPDVSVPGYDIFRVERGQMMGSLLSFPLLCLYNRICSVFALGRVPMLINGDDLLAETSNPEPWFQVLPSLGLRPERSKSGYSTRRFEINSTPFVVVRGIPEKAPVIRCRALLPRAGIASNWYATARQFASEAGHMTGKALDVFFDVRRSIIIKALNHGLDLPDCAFIGDRAQHDAARWGLIAYSRRTALNLPMKSHLPASPASQVTPARKCARAPKSVIDKAQKIFFGDLFGQVMTYSESVRSSKVFWEELAWNRPRLVRPIDSTKRLFALVGQWSNASAPKLYWGEPMSKAVFERRLLGRMASVEEKRSHRVPLCLMSLVPVTDRWGL